MILFNLFFERMLTGPAFVAATADALQSFAVAARQIVAVVVAAAVAAEQYAAFAVA